VNAAFTFIEPFPVGLLITLISAASYDGNDSGARLVSRWCQPCARVRGGKKDQDADDPETMSGAAA